MYWLDGADRLTNWCSFERSIMSDKANVYLLFDTLGKILSERYGVNIKFTVYKKEIISEEQNDENLNNIDV
jgi:hypothetical protein